MSDEWSDLPKISIDKFEDIIFITVGIEIE